MRKELLRKCVVCMLTISMLCMGMCMPMRVNAATLAVGAALKRNVAVYHTDIQVLKEKKGGATFQMCTGISPYDCVSVNAVTYLGKNVSNGVNFKGTTANYTQKSSYLSGYGKKGDYYCSKEILLIDSYSPSKNITLNFTP